MASVEQQVPAGVTAPTADVVGNAFVNQYYHILHHSPELVHRFYHDSSKLGRPEETGVMRFTTMQGTKEGLHLLVGLDTEMRVQGGVETMAAAAAGDIAGESLATGASIEDFQTTVEVMDIRGVSTWEVVAAV
ncbi:uncharacterized protein LOC120133124 [Hibiscus syriacus]|uniref:uncharacterized protein LOC120133124 n=1 Tax=Hibiscus syriacus TaxID=106335 RepID=UPI001920A991|nr:uncharacterized protein LOC120133124 [Hibiscus syriacus]